jgi:hypothetical protein
MKKYFTNLCLFAVTLAILTFGLVTAKVENVCDGEHFTAYGFPLVWSTPGATSLSTAVDLMSGIFDLLVYFAFFAALTATSIFDKLFGRKKILIATLLWIAALIVGGFFLVLLSFDLYSQQIFPFPCEQRSYMLHFAFPFGR